MATLEQMEVPMELDMQNLEPNPRLQAKRRSRLLRCLGPRRPGNRVVALFRAKQRKLVQNIEDPDPFEPTYLFYITPPVVEVLHDPEPIFPRMEGGKLVLAPRK